VPVLDTSFLVDLERGDPRATRALQKLAKGDLELPWHAAVELLVGREDPVATLAALGSSYQVRFPAEGHLLEAARLRRLHPDRRHVRWGDIYIACAAILSATFVVTADPADFRSLGCQVWDYRKDPSPPAG
jgi:predicted nucleic acid-binding protein